MTRHLLTADQVARRLGVQVATVYAYVSRGVLHRTVADDGRTSNFDVAEVDRVARRGRPRNSATRQGGIDVSLATAVTLIEADRLSYRGHDATVLATTSSFERVGELLWTGELPASATWPLPPACARLARTLRRTLPRTTTPLERFAVASAAIAPLFPWRNDLRPRAVLDAGRALATTFTEALPFVAGAAPELAAEAPGEPSIAARLWPRLSSLPARRARVALLDAALIVLADHELATSTMAVRVAASTRANPFAAVLAGLGALDGPLHGGAAIDCHRLLLAARQVKSAEAVARALATHSLRGFGHPVYRDRDPRATTLLGELRSLASKKDQALIDDVLSAAVPVAGAQPNSDFALAAIAFAMEMPLGATEAIFALGRTAGWLAHALEEYSEEPLRFRARAIYVGKDGVGQDGVGQGSRPATR